MAYDNSEEINNIRIQADIIDVISDYIPLTQKGKNHFCVCPFHDDHSPSMSISKDKQIYKCFSCGASGNVFTFVQNYENTTFMEAVGIVAAKVGIHLNKHTIQKPNTKFKKEFELYNLVQKFYQNNLNTDGGKKAIKYLSDRGINDEVIKTFGIGLSLEQTDTLYTLLTKKNFSKKELSEIGLISINESKIYDLFINRIMFPIHDSEGNIVAFSGRVYTETKNSKYVNTKETIIFKKGHILYNYHRAKDVAKREKNIIVVEGHLDAIRLYSCGVKNVVALMGTSFTKEQSDLLKKMRVPVTLCLDNDAAGERATYSIGEDLTKENVPINVIRLSGAKDPDEYIINKGIEAFEDNLKNPVNYFEFKLQFLKLNKNLKNTEELAEYINDVIKSLNNIEDEVLRSLTITKISEEHNISIDVLEKKLNSLTKKQSKETQIAVDINKPRSKTGYSNATTNIFYFMINDSSYIKSYLKKLGFFPKQSDRELANEIVYYYEKNKTINLADFISFVGTNEKLNDRVLTIISDAKITELDNKIFEESIDTVKKEINKIEVQKVKKDLREELDMNRKIELANRLIELKKEV